MSDVFAQQLDPKTFPWVSRWRASDQPGGDGTPLTTLAGTVGSVLSGTGTLKTGVNGINGQNVILFNGTSDKFTGANGGASLTGDFYIYAVAMFSNLTGYQTLVSWGQELTGKRRELIKVGTAAPNTNGVAFNGSSADVLPGGNGNGVIAANTPYLLEITRSGTLISVYLNGIFVAAGTPALSAYTGTAINFGSNNAGGELFAGSFAEGGMIGSMPSIAQISAIGDYVRSTYGIQTESSPRVSGAMPEFDTNGLLSRGVGWQSGLIKKPNGLYSLRATTLTGSLNVLRLQNTNPNGYSVVYGAAHDVVDSTEGHGSAYGWGNTGGGGIWGGAGFWEVYDVVTANFYPARLIQTIFTGSYRRIESKGPGEAVNIYNRSATYPNEGQVVSTGVTPVVVANAGVSITDVVTPAYGLLIIRDDTNHKTGIYKIENTTLTMISADAEFNTTKDNAGTVNIYSESNSIKIQNNSGGSLNLTAAYYGA